MSLWRLLLLFGNFFSSGNGQCPKILSREEWGARSPVETPETIAGPLPFTVVHHGGSKQYCTTQEECTKMVRNYQDFHMDKRGWNDIGYNFVVGEDGNIYEGRGWDTMGAHAPTYNSRSVGICVIGDFSNRLPNEAALNAVKDLIQCGVSTNKLKEGYKLIGHRQSAASSTKCPGDAFYEEITQWSHWTPDASFDTEEEQQPEQKPEEIVEEED